jgi:hypothetical protein
MAAEEPEALAPSDSPLADWASAESEQADRPRARAPTAARAGRKRVFIDTSSDGSGRRSTPETLGSLFIMRSIVKSLALPTPNPDAPRASTHTDDEGWPV